VSGVDAVVVAAGASTRMGGADKLGLLVGGRPMLAWTLAALAAAPIIRRIRSRDAGVGCGRFAAAPGRPSGSKLHDHFFTSLFYSRPRSSIIPPEQTQSAERGGHGWQTRPAKKSVTKK
jgi:hypothetical protein